MEIPPREQAMRTFALGSLLALTASGARTPLEVVAGGDPVIEPATSSTLTCTRRLSAAIECWGITEDASELSPRTATCIHTVS